jgi:hypothetical protein
MPRRGSRRPFERTTTLFAYGQRTLRDARDLVPVGEEARDLELRSDWHRRR